MIQLVFEVKFLSDFHPGSGHGHGSLIDSAVRKNSSQIPESSGKTISGLLAEEMGNLLRLNGLNTQSKCLKSGKEGADKYCLSDPCPVCRIFGSPASQGRWIIGNMAPVGFNVPLLKKSSVTYTSTISSTKINLLTNRAQSQSLRTIESCDKTVQYEFTVSTEDKEVNLFDIALITASARMIKRIGLKRRRGVGSCEISLKEIKGHEQKDIDLKDAKLQDFILDALFDHKNRKINAQISTQDMSKITTTSTGQIIYDLFVRLDSPVLHSKNAGGGNAFESLDYLSGNIIMGAFARKAARNITDEKKFVSLFRRGDIKFCNCYPTRLATGGGTLFISIPSPHDAVQCKAWNEQIDTKHHIMYKFSGKQPNDNCEIENICKGKDIPLKRVKGFLCPDNMDKKANSPIRDNIHNEMDRQKGKTKEGQLYNYQLLEAGSYYHGSIIFKDLDTLSDFITFTGIDITNNNSFELHIGKAHNKGYGKVALSAVSHKGILPKIEDRMKKENQFHILYFLSDAILLDEFGRTVLSPDANFLKIILGIEIKNIQSAIRVERRNFFNKKTGLPDFSDMCITAGSVIRFEICDSNSFDTLFEKAKEIEQNGIGERVNIGYGRVLFDLPNYYGKTNFASSQTIPECLRIGSDISSQKTLEDIIEQLEKENKISGYIKPKDTKDKTFYENLGFLLMCYPTSDIEEIKSCINSWGKGRKKKEQFPDENLLRQADNLLNELNNHNLYGLYPCATLRAAGEIICRLVRD